MVAPPCYKHYPRSVSWQVASVLNPSLQTSLPTSQLSSHSRAKREREGVKADESARKPQVISTAFKAWQEEEEEGGQRVTLPPQYVSPGELCKAMPKYIRLKMRPKSNGTGQPVAFSTATATATDPVNPSSPALMSPRYDLAAGSPRSHDSSGRETPRLVLDLPTKGTMGKASPSLLARSLLTTPKPSCGTTPPMDTLLSGRQIANPSRRIQSAMTLPMLLVPTEGYKVMPTNATLLWSKLNTMTQCPEQVPRMAVMESTTQGSPLSPTSMQLRSRQISMPSLASEVPLPLTPPIGPCHGSRQQRVRGPHPPEPTIETYKKTSPNLYATNAAWNDRHDAFHEQINLSQSILIKAHKF